MKFLKTIPVILLIFALCSCGKNSSVPEQDLSNTANTPVPTHIEETFYLTGTYRVYADGYDWGPAVNRAIISFDQTLDSVSKEDFTVMEVKSATDYSQEDMPVVTQTFSREVTNAYFSDVNGNPVAAPSNIVTLDLYVSPVDGSPINYDPASGFNTWCDTYALDIRKSFSATLTSNGRAISGMDIDTRMTALVTSVDDVIIDSFTSSDRVTYQYAHYEPADGSKTLIVWLHGGGEGGTRNTDPRIPMLACKSSVLMREEFQNAVGGANILIPQCPTLWMDMNGGGRTTDILDANDGTSFYTNSLKELIEFYREKSGSETVILAGCSNGGFMSLVLALADPRNYDAVVPICETLRDETITDEQLQGVLRLPLYFIYSKDDEVALPDLNSIPTIARLNSMGAQKLHVSTSEHVIDTSGLYQDNAEPYQYMGHWSWIYFFNNETSCDYHGETAWSVIAEAARS